MKKFIKAYSGSNIMTGTYLGVFDHMLDPEDYEVGDYFRFNETIFGDDVLWSSTYACIDEACIDEQYNNSADGGSLPKQEVHESSIHKIINNWTDREWELYLTLPKYAQEDKMIIDFDKWLKEDLTDEDRIRLDFREVEK